MQPFREKSTQKTVDDLSFIMVINPHIWLALATLPCLGLLVLGRSLTYWLTQFGMASEEIFRGIQLPVLESDPRQHL